MSSRVDDAVVLVGPDDASRNVAGVPLLVRTVLALQRAGITRCTLVGAIEPLTDPRIRCTVRTTPSLEPPTDDALRIVVGPGTVIDETLVSTLVEKAGAGGPLEVGRGDARVRVVAGGGLADGGLAAVPPPSGTLEPADGPVGATERALLRGLENPRDGYLDRLLYRRLSRPLTRVLLRTSLSPNAVTVLGVLLGVAGGLLLGVPGWAGVIGAVAFLLASSVLDCSDGEIARVRFAESRLGHWLDVGGDTLVHGALLSGIALRLADDGAVPGWLALAVLGVGVLGAFAGITWSEHAEAERRRVGGWENRILDGVLSPLSTRDWYVFPVGLAVVGRLDWLIPAAAVGAHVFWVSVVVLVRRALRRSARGMPDGKEARLRRQVYDFADISRFPPGRRLLIRCAGVAFHWVIALIGRTLRFERVDLRPIDEIHRAGRRFIAAFWHNRVFLATWFWRGRGVVVMTSQSFDGEYIARFIQRFGYGAARGSATRGGSRAMVLLRSCLRHGMDVAFTIDGPRGPRYVAKPGAVWLARATGEPILPAALSAERYWEVGSWDGFRIPKPFTRVVVLFGRPIYVSADGGDDEIAARQDELQASLDDLRERADAHW